MAPQPEAQPAADWILQDLRRRILLFELRPGERLVEEEIARHYGLSRTPVREALKRLQQAGLVRSVPRRGCYVREIILPELEEFYEVRVALETYAVAVAVQRMSESAIERLWEIWAEVPATLPDADRLLAMDEAFHLEIARACDNATFVKLLQSINDQIRVVRIRDHMSPQRVAATYRQHRAVLHLLRERDADGAVRAMREHILESKSNVVNIVKDLLLSVYSRRQAANPSE